MYFFGGYFVPLFASESVKWYGFHDSIMHTSNGNSDVDPVHADKKLVYKYKYIYIERVFFIIVFCRSRHRQSARVVPIFSLHCYLPKKHLLPHYPGKHLPNSWRCNSNLIESFSQRTHPREKALWDNLRDSRSWCLWAVKCHARDCQEDAQLFCRCCSVTWGFDATLRYLQWFHEACIAPSHTQCSRDKIAVLLSQIQQTPPITWAVLQAP